MQDYLELTVDKFIFKVKRGLLYHTGGCWFKVKNGLGTIGLTDFFQQNSGDTAFIELPEPGKNITAGKKFGLMETIKSIVDLISPVDGEVMEINPIVSSAPEKINEDPYGNGWLIRVKLAQCESLANLMNDEGYFSFMEKNIKSRL